MSVMISEPTRSAPAKGTITTDIIISELPDDVIAALDLIAERVAMSREDFISAVSRGESVGDGDRDEAAGR